MDLCPSFDSAHQAARLYLTAKTVTPGYVTTFAEELAKIVVSEAERTRHVLAWQQWMSNSGKMNQAAAAAAAAKRAAYAAGHAGRVKTFLEAWLVSCSGASEECDTRITTLRAALERAL